MKQKFYLFILLFFIFKSNVHGQFVNYENDRGWNLGFNMGGTWQRMENNFFPKAGYSFGLTFGKSIYEKEGAFFAFDWRFRYLRGKSFGWQTTPSYDPLFAYHPEQMGYRNYKLDLNEFTIEGVLTLHRLRERTGILLYGFGGLGFTDYRVRSNYSSTFYNFDYSNIDSLQSPEEIADDLDRLEDRKYERDAEHISGSEFKFMPSLGFGIGYQFTEHFAMGLEHKTTFALHDRLDGTLNGINDKYHYTALYFRWNLFSGNRPTYVPNNNNNNVIIAPPPPADITPTGNKPLVKITNPATSGTTVNNPNYTVTANIYYVPLREKVIFKHNGVLNPNFNYDPATNSFTAQVLLFPGSNKFEITGSNDFGSDSDSKTIIYQQEVPSLPKPIVDITNPPNTPHEVNQQGFNVLATIKHVASKANVTFTLNGNTLNQFNYDPDTDAFSATINLSPGENKIVITGQNTVGSDLDEAVIIWKSEVVTPNPPVVDITNPSSTPHEVGNKNFTVKANVYYVASKADITVLVNNMATTQFSFNVATRKLELPLLLNAGNNYVKITGTNSVGSDSEATTIIYKVPEAPILPAVKFTSPVGNPINVGEEQQPITATTANIFAQSELKVFLNGLSVSLFTFNPATAQVNFTAKLLEGKNDLKITGQNSHGYAEDNMVIYYKKAPCNAPTIVRKHPVSANSNTSNSKGSIELQISGANRVRFKTNGKDTPGFSYDQSTGKFLALLHLEKGTTQFEIVAINECGETAELITINYEPTAIPCNAPLISVTQPTELKISIKAAAYTIKAKIENVTNQQEITVFASGKSVNFLFNPLTKELSALLTLNDGVNEVNIKASNSCGTDEKSFQVEKLVPCTIPEIKRVRPQADSTTSETASVNASFITTFVSNKEMISCKFNGQDVPFTWTNSGNLSVQLNVPIGRNKLIVTVSAPCGSNSQTLYFIRPAPCNPPTLALVNPKTNPANVSGDLFKAVIQTTFAQQATFTGTVNGQTANMAYDAKSEQVMVEVKLVTGTNEVKIAANNGCGSDEISFILNVPAPLPPVVNITTPNSDNVTINQMAYTVVAEVLHVSGKEDIKIDFNGTNHTNFTYNASTKKVNVPLSLIYGINRIKITGTNAVGTANDGAILTLPCQQASVVYTNIPTGTSSQSPHIINENTFVLKALVTHPNFATVKVFNEGAVYNNFTFNDQTGEVLINLSYNVSNEFKSIKVRVSNDCSTMDVNGFIKYVNTSHGQTENTNTQEQPNNTDDIDVPANTQQNTDNARVDSQYKATISKADMYYNARKWETAKTHYQQALELKPNESHPKLRLAEIEKKLKPKTLNKPTPPVIQTPQPGKTNTPGEGKTPTTKEPTGGKEEGNSSSTQGSTTRPASSINKNAKTTSGKSGGS